MHGISNRAAIEAEAIRAIGGTTRPGASVSLLILDLDHFKAINDQHGHAAGDRVLRAAADAWHTVLRGRDPLGRIGGEEFVVVCADTSLEQAMVVAERLREATTALRFDDIDPALRVTVSIGVAEFVTKRRQPRRRAGARRRRALSGQAARPRSRRTLTCGWTPGA